MRRLLLLFLLKFIFFYTYQPVSANIYFKHLGKSEGLSQISVLSICQDELGRMWFGTLEGLSRYDGETMATFKSSDPNLENILGNETHDVVSNKDGSIFFTSDKKLIRYNIYTEEFICLRESVTNDLHVRNDEVWMATRDSVFIWNEGIEQFEFIYHLEKDLTINCIYADDNRLWIGTTLGLYRVNNLKTQTEPECIIPNENIYSLYKDSRKRMWVAAFRRGMFKIENDTYTRYSAGKEGELSNNDIRGFVEDNLGNIWVSTFDGLNKIDKQDKITSYKKDLLSGGLKHSSIFALYKDSQGTIWIGTYYGGIHYFNPEMDIFTHYSEDVERSDCLSFFFIGKMIEDKRGDVWICTEGGGLNHLNRQTGKITHYLADGKPGSIPFNNLKCIAYDDKADRLYVGTHTRGLFCFDILIRQVVSHYQPESTLFSLAVRNDKLYFLSAQGMFMMELKTNAISRVLPKEETLSGSNFIIDSANNIWITKGTGLLRSNLDNPENKQFYKYGENGLSNLPVLCMAEYQDKNVYVGSNGAGVFKFNALSGSFEKCSGIGNHYCYDMVESQNNCLILACEQGITYYNPVNGDTKTINMNNEPYLSSLNDGCGILVCRNGEVFVGGTNGMTSYMENRLFDPSPYYNMYFSSLSVNNTVVRPGASHILSTALPFVQKVNLRHNQNNIVVTFTTSNYTGNLGKYLYEYKLEGFNDNWISARSKNIVYTNLNPGKYTLIVREKNQDVYSYSRDIKLQILVRSPWYATWYAYCCYVLLVSAIAYALIRDRRIKLLLRNSLAEKKREEKNNQEITQAKLQFFSNISHEFRTPLTLIISQIEMLLNGSSISPFIRTRLQKIYKNTFQLRELISELLDFRKMEQKGLHLRVSHANLIPYLKNICQTFQDQASVQNINFTTHFQTEHLMCWYDAKQLKKVFSNLLSNAFKFTPEKGEVKFIVNETDESIEIKVVDTGVGIIEEALPHIFDRFYQAGTTSSGSGIGLALSKGIVDLHHGTIEVKSAPEYGSMFTVCLPKENPFKEDTSVTFAEPEAGQQEYINKINQPEEVATDTEEVIPEETTQLDEKACILLVEDNEELLQLLTSLLSPLYRVVIAMDGKDGLNKATEEQPDLIVSDVMMPIMSGTEMCLKIKNNFELCHIPVILLTAFSSEANRLQGLQCGADDYIAKPFNNKLLLSRIANIIRNRKLLKKKYGDMLLAEQPKTDIRDLALTAIDRKFLAQLNEIVERHISDSEFDINMLTRELGVSRSSLYNKLKSLSSMTPNEFILNLRLKYAAQLLKNNPELQITEIAYQAGFNSLRYFRHCFKAQFNQTPQEYRSEVK